MHKYDKLNYLKHSNYLEKRRMLILKEMGTLERAGGVREGC